MYNKRQKSEFFISNFFSKNRRGIASEFLPWLIIAIAVLAIVLISIFLLKGKGISLIEQIKNLFSFGK
ncbi:hypothetical protein HY449_01430 [Candidatus Pacearchaeota archaeon]|nr:hypothetical protein [Candidatus Pacearchaeota archaeon]